MDTHDGHGVTYLAQGARQEALSPRFEVKGPLFERPDQEAQARPEQERRLPGLPCGAPRARPKKTCFFISPRAARGEFSAPSGRQVFEKMQFWPSLWQWLYWALEFAIPKTTFYHVLRSITVEGDKLAHTDNGDNRQPRGCLPKRDTTR